MNEQIKKSINVVGSQSHLARLCGVSQGAVGKWLNGGEYSAKYAWRIEQTTQGKVTAVELYRALDDLDK